MSQHGLNRANPTVLVLESRDVPATFYVDPLFAGVPNGTAVTFNAFGPNAVTGKVVGADAFATLSAALAKAALNTEADTILLARSRFDGNGGAVTGTDLVPNRTPVDNTAGPILIADNITLVGSGMGATVLAPTADTGDDLTGVFEVATGKAFVVRDLTLDGSGFQVGVGFRFGSTFAANVVGTVERVEVTNVGFGVLGTGIGAYEGARVTVADSKLSGYGRIGVQFEAADGSVTGSTITGKGAGTTFVNYGIQASYNSHVVITGNTITGNVASAPGPFLSAGVNLFEDAGAAPTATVTRNTITGNTFGVRVGGQFGVDRSQASIRDNNLQSNFLAIQADNKSNVDAVNNWFGSASGPFNVSTNKAGTGSEVTDRVIYAPWRTTPFTDTKTVVNTVVETKVVTVAQPLNPAPVPGFAVGGNGSAGLLGNNFATLLEVKPFAGFAGEVRVTRADVTGDGTPDVVATAGLGGGPRVVVLDGRTGAEVSSFFAYDRAFTGGVFVAAADLNGDGKADIVTGAGAGGGSNVKVFDGATGGLLRSFFAYVAGFTGGVTVAVGDVTGDGKADIVTGAGTGGGSHVRVFDGITGTEVRSFFAYDRAFTGGIFVAVGDVNGDGFADVITGAGLGGGSNVRIFDGQTNQLRNSFFANNSADSGVRVAAQDLDGDGKADLIFGQGPSGDNRVRVTTAADLAAGSPAPKAQSEPLFIPSAFGPALFGVNSGLNVG